MMPRNSSRNAKRCDDVTCVCDDVTYVCDDVTYVYDAEELLKKSEEMCSCACVYVCVCVAAGGWRLCGAEWVGACVVCVCVCVCVIVLLLQNVFSDCRMCSLTVECLIEGVGRLLTQQ